MELDEVVHLVVPREVLRDCCWAGGLVLEVLLVVLLDGW